MKDALDGCRICQWTAPVRGARSLGLWLGFLVAGLSGSAGARDAEVVAVENIVQVARSGGAAWSTAEVGQALTIRDRVRTRQRSRATVRLSDLYSMRLDQFTTIEITPAITGAQKPRLDVKRGVMFIFSRAQDGEIDIRTPTANAALRGTQLVVEVGEAGRTKITVLEGIVDLSNDHGRLALKAGESGVVVAGQAPRPSPAIQANTILQWTLYYPAVLDPGELGAGILEARSLGGSVSAYRSGDLLGALERYPPYSPRSESARVYKAGVYLAVGRVDEAAALLKRVPRGNRARRALERTIAAVNGEPQEPWRLEDLQTATESLAESYYRQSRFDLAGALKAAELATRLSPENGYAWTRQAEVEFSFGRNQEAKRLLDMAIRFTPRNAQAHAVLGFILASENRLDEALASFNTAIDLDSSLGNGWLGRGLVKIRKGDLAGGRADIQIAATVEPTVSIFHSYLGKAFGEEGKHGLAIKDLDLARTLDPNDPTPWLYSAIERQRTNRPNQAIADLEESIRLNNNRRVYRSNFRLDQDRAVRGANLASIYQYAGMNAVAVREASRAVENDYTNASAHLFLANSFDALRDPNRISLRYETPWFNELFLSNLFSPVGGGPLSQFVSQQEYSKFFAQDGIGGSILGEWRSDPEVRNVASVYGTHGNVSWGFDFEFRDDDGDRSNADSELFETYGQLKMQVTPTDILYLLGKWQDQESGDNIQTFNNEVLNPDLDFVEDQGPGLALAGWNHEWAPGTNTLFLGGRLAADQRLRDPMTSQLLIERDKAGLSPDFIRTRVIPGTSFELDEFVNPALGRAVPFGPDGMSLDYHYNDAFLPGIAPYVGMGDVLGYGLESFSFETRRDIEIYTAEVQHIIQNETNTVLFGGRYQEGEIKASGRLDLLRDRGPGDDPVKGGFSTPASEQSFSWDTERLSFYVYDYWNVIPELTLIGGLAWDRVEHPENFRNPPLNQGTKTDEKLSGKAGFTYAPSEKFTMRGVYAEGLGGITFDESVRLEPVQLAGFNQAFRTVISESLAGSIEAPEFTTYGLSLEGALASRTWWGLSWNVIEQDVERSIGVFTGYDASVFPSSPAYFPDSTPQILGYDEQSLTATLNQLVGGEWAVGAMYRVTRSELEQTLPALVGAPLGPGQTDISHTDNGATLHELSLFADWNSPTGVFAHLEANWYGQDLDDDSGRLGTGATPRSDDEFFHVNTFMGYRFDDNRGEVSAGFLNLFDVDYQLSPLNPYLDLPRERTFLLRYRWNF